MTADLIARLRDYTYQGDSWKTQQEAADAIERLERELSECQRERDEAINYAKNNEIMIAECQRENTRLSEVVSHVNRTNDHLGMTVRDIKQERDELRSAAQNLVNVKGRYHTEQAYARLEAALAKVGADKTGETG